LWNGGFQGFTMVFSEINAFFIILNSCKNQAIKIGCAGLKFFLLSCLLGANLIYRLHKVLDHRKSTLYQSF